MKSFDYRQALLGSSLRREFDSRHLHQFFVRENMKKRKAKARRNRYFTNNVGNENGKYCSFSAWKKRERANEKEGLKSE